MSINEAIRQAVRERAQYLCEYYHSSEEVSAAQFAVDHILPRSLGGSHRLDNLAMACQRCNSLTFPIFVFGKYLCTFPADTP
jgi:5-methylcytosine-specific restriction endonuclease McrA